MLLLRTPRRVITRGVIDMATSRVLETDSYFYSGEWARADAASSEALQKAIKEALGEHHKKVKEVLDAVEKNVKDFGSVQDGVKTAVAKLNEDGAKLIADLQTLKAEKAANDARLLDLEQKALARGAGGGGAKIKSLGQMVIESQEWKDFAARAGSLRMSMKPFAMKTITTITGGAGAFPEFLPTPVIPPFQPLTIRDLLDVGTTTQNLIEWVQETLFTNAAAPVSEGGLKPMSDITYTRESIPIRTVAHWVKASKQILADFSQLMTLINGRLTFGLKLVEERQILYGDGTGDNLLGLIPQATAYNAGSFHKGNDTRIDVIRHAMLQVNLAFYPCTGIAMSPTDWHDLELTKDSLGRYMISSPTQSTPGMLWGLPVAQCYSMAAGEFLVGAFKLCATLFDREEAQILVSNEDQDNFVRNMVSILCEERIGLAVSRPQALIHGFIPVGESTEVAQ
jgi:HK97 family phage major capsid protein